MKKSNKELLFERMHTIGGMPLKESNIQSWKNNISLIKQEFVNNKLTLTNTYYHGTKNSTIIKIMVNGARLYNHSELQINTFSVSTNKNVLQYFGEYHGSGFIFPNVTLNLIDIPEFYYYLLAYETGMVDETEWMNDPNSELYQKAIQLGFKTRFSNEIGIENQDNFMDLVLPHNIDGLILFEDGMENSEDETALLQSGLQKIFEKDFTVLFENDYYSKNEMIQYIKNNPDEVQEYLESDDDDDFF